MDLKHREVVHWLQEIYGSERIPPYEKTEYSINLLYQLMTRSKCAEEQGKILTADNAKKAAEYNAEALQLKKWRETIQIEPSILSEESQKALLALAHTAQVLDVQTPTTSNILLAVNQLEMEHMEVVNEEEQEKKRITALLEMIKDLSNKVKEMREITKRAEAVWEADKEELAKDARWKQFSLEKCKNYSDELTESRARLSQLGLKKEIMHGSICEQSTTLQALEKEAAELEKKLSRYTLPPDLRLAELKLKEAQEELTRLMDGLANKCESEFDA